MKNLNFLNKYRIRHPTEGMGDHSNGCFLIKPSTGNLVIIASTGEGWDHVSVSCKDRIPSWTEMRFIKELFFKLDEGVIQYHPPMGENINCYANCLHLWRPQFQDLPWPPKWMIA